MNLASGKQQLLLLKIDDSKEIYYDPAPAQYYMDDMNEGVTYIHGFPMQDISKNMRMEAPWMVLYLQMNYLLNTILN